MMNIALLASVISVASPQIRSMGVENYTLGLREQLVFPEIEYDKIDKLRGLEVTIVTTATNDDHGRELLHMLGMPFKKEG